MNAAGKRRASVRKRMLSAAHGIHKHPSLYVFKTGWDIFEILVPFMLQETLEDTLQIYYPGPVPDRAIAYGGAAAVFLIIYFTLDFWAYSRRHAFDLQQRMKSMPNKGRGMTGKYILESYKHDGEEEGESTKSTQEHSDLTLFEQDKGASMTVDADKGTLERPHYDFSTVVIIRLVKIMWFLCALTLKDFIEDLIEIHYPVPSRERASLWGGSSLIGFFFLVVGIFLIPVIQQSCKKHQSQPTPASTPTTSGYVYPIHTTIPMPVDRVQPVRRTTIGAARKEQEGDSRRRDRLASLAEKDGHVSSSDIHNALNA